MLPALVLPAALTLLILATARGAKSWREAVVTGLVAFGAAVAWTTEILGAFGLLRPAEMFFAWLLVAAGGLLYSLRNRSLAAFPGLPRRTGPFEPFVAASLLLIAVLIGIAAVLSPPNSTDAMSYHLPRVVYWAQAGSVRFFPTTYFPQIMLQPLAEYFVLHTYVLSGGDRLANLVQFLGYIGSITAVSLIARELGASRRGQILAALFCATIPNAILQASGAKNDCLLSLWLAAMTWFALRFRERPSRAALAGLSASLGLALMTKATAYIFAPAMLGAVFAPVLWKRRREWPGLAVALALGILAFNGPHYWRNIEFSGSLFGFESAHGDGGFRWQNDRFGARTTASNILRNLSEHLPARSPEWNRRVYQFVLDAHRAIGADPNDPATTWRWAGFQPPVNSNHEANSPNRWHLVLLAAVAMFLAVAARRPAHRPWLWYFLGVVVAFLMFCSYLKWQPYFTRLHLPLFVLASPAAGWLAGRLRFPVLQAALALFLINSAKPYLLENWTRPLKGPRSVFHISRQDGYFADMGGFADKRDYLEALARTRQAQCTEIGIDDDNFPLEYPYQALLREGNPRVHFQHVGVTNRSARYARPQPPPCAVLCLNCAGNQQKAALHARTGPPVEIGRFLLFLR